MEGSYSKVWNAREEAPAEEYKFFVDSLMGTIRCVFFFFSLCFGIKDLLACRNEIASCEEAAYESLPLKDAATLLFFTSQSELLKFAQQVGVLSGHIYFFTWLNSAAARMASESHGIFYYFRAEGRGADGNTEAETHRGIPSLCSGTRTNCIDD